MATPASPPARLPVLILAALTLTGLIPLGATLTPQPDAPQSPGHDAPLIQTPHNEPNITLPTLPTLTQASAFAPQPAQLGTQATSTPCEEGQTHPPIRITEDHGEEGFTWTNPDTGEEEPRPGSGVTSGQGTPQDPFMIQADCIQPETETSGILIQNTQKHATIHDTTIHGHEEAPGIHVDHAPNITIQATHVKNASHGIAATHTQHVTVHASNVSDNQGPGIGFWNTTDARIHDNTITNNTLEGIGLYSESDHALVQANTLTENGRHGIYLISQNATVQSNTITDTSSTAIYIQRANATLQGNTIDDAAYGVLATNAQNAALHENTIQNARGAGIGFTSTHNATLTNNTVRDNFTPGIGLIGSHDATLLNNTAKRHNYEGILVHNSHNATLDGNTATDNNRHGLLILGSNHAHATRTNATNNQGTGIAAMDANHPHLAHNTVRSNQDDWGIYADGIHPTLHNNTVHDNNGQGALLSQPITARITQNAFTNNAQSGLLIENAQQATLRGNTADDNQDTGLELQTTHNATLHHNTAKRNGLWGILLDTGEDPTLAHNTAHDNQGTGIRLASTPNPTLHNNTITNNAFDGLVLQNADQAKLHHNEVNANDRDGILLTGTQNATLQANNVTDNETGINTNTPATLHDNNIHGNLIGLDTLTQAPTDARWNWWGCTQGPQNAECDPTLGNAQTSPHLTQPNTHAGIRDRAPTLDPLPSPTLNPTEPLTLPIQATHPDDKPTTLTALEKPTGATFTDHGDATATLDWTPTSDDAGQHPLTVQANDGNRTANATTIITIVPWQPPSLTAPTQRTLATDHAHQIHVQAADPNQETITLHATNLPDEATFQTGNDEPGTAQGTLSWTPTSTDTGEHTITFEATDESGDTNTTTTTLTVIQNQPPSIQATGPHELDAREQGTFTAQGTTDPDGSDDQITYTWTFETPDDATIQKNGHTLENAFQQMGTYTATLQARDTAGLTNTTTVTVHVDDAIFTSHSLLNVDPARVDILERPLLAVSVTDDLDEPVDADVRLHVEHEDLGTTLDATLSTGDNGLLLYKLPHTLSAQNQGTNLPGEHTITLHVTAQPREGAPTQEENRSHATQTYTVTIP